jgi:hypothetical protein
MPTTGMSPVTIPTFTRTWVAISAMTPSATNRPTGSRVEAAMSNPRRSSNA